MNTKQVIVVRKDLNMRKGKIAAQVAHASMSFLTKQTNILYDNYYNTPYLDVTIYDEAIDWLEGSFAKVCVYVNSEQELLDIVSRAREKGLVNHVVTDSGRTEFNGIPTKTCAAIGPHEVSKFEGVTDHLPLL